MNYQHAYHAGNFSDVLKHVTLIDLLNHLLQKEAAIAYIDTHAGDGEYDLTDIKALKTNEAKQGILTILKKHPAPAIIKQYCDLVTSCNHNTKRSVTHYPGSPAIAKKMLRPQDRLILCEAHPTVFETLKQFAREDTRIAAHATDGYLGLKAFLPPKERRGLVLIDPPFEKQDEFKQISQQLNIALKRWDTGVYAIWYPIKTRNPVDAFYRSLKGTIKRPMLAIECLVHDVMPERMNGSGMVIINPPWQLAASIQSWLPWLWKALSPEETGNYQMFMLQSE